MNEQQPLPASAVEPSGQRRLFDPGPPLAEQPPGPRGERAVRDQVQYWACCWDDLIPPEHQVRIVWSYVQGLDLGPLLARIKATLGEAGAPASDPAILLALWL